ncbi:MAG: metallopeptidase family protein [Nitriliruptoraceae bacterium]
MTSRRERHARHRRTVSDRRRRPVDGFRTLTAARFDRLVAQALDDLPAAVHAQLANVQITVDDVPQDDADVLLGLYEGIPQPDRDFGEAMLPDRITIFRRPIEARAATPRELQEIVRDTVIHEVAHHFGIDDDRLDELGWS